MIKVACAIDRRRTSKWVEWQGWEEGRAQDGKERDHARIGVTSMVYSVCVQHGTVFFVGHLFRDAVQPFLG